MGEVRAGLRDTDPEVVLRGGHLDKPTLLGNLTIVEGHKFVHLWKGCPILNKFLTGKSAMHRPLANSSAIENLAAKRNEAFREILADEEDGGEEADDPVDALGLDEEDDVKMDYQKSKKNGRSECQKSKARKYLPIRMKMMSRPSFLPVEVQGGFAPSGESAPWRPLVLLEVASTAPAMEATSENFKALFDLVASELAGGLQKRERYPRRTGIASGSEENTALYQAKTKKDGTGGFYFKEVLETPSKRPRPYAKCYKTRRLRPEGGSGTLSKGTESDKEGAEDCLDG